MNWKLKLGLIAMSFSPAVCVAQQSGGAAKDGTQADFNVQMAVHIIRTDLVREELQMTAQQIEKTAHLEDALAEALQDAIHVATTLPRDQQKQPLDDAEAPLRRRLVETLSPSQLKRLREILVQFYGPGEFDPPEEDKEFDLSRQQIERVSEVLNDRFQRKSKVAAEMGLDIPQQVTPEIAARCRRYSEKEHAVDREALDRILNVLTAAQRDKLKKMSGKAVDLKELHRQESALKSGVPYH
jgi:hypothetical protein